MYSAPSGKISATNAGVEAEMTTKVNAAGENVSVNKQTERTLPLWPHDGAAYPSLC
jgi:hypothetical protein